MIDFKDRTDINHNASLKAGRIVMNTYEIRHTLRIYESCDGHWVESYPTAAEATEAAKQYKNPDTYTVERGVGIYQRYDQHPISIDWVCDCAHISIAKKLLSFLNGEK